MCAAYRFRQSNGQAVGRSSLAEMKPNTRHAGVSWVHYGNCSRSIIGRRWSFSFCAFRTSPSPRVDRQELLYNASLLAHYAQVSTQPDVDVPAPANLSAVFDHFVSDTTLLHDSLMMETAGAQCLLLAGFFEDQMRPRHNIRWYAELGASFFSRAALHERSLAQSPAARRHREALRAVASAPRAAEPRAAGPALSADPACATHAS